MTAFEPYIIENGVSLVDLLGVVWYIHNTCGNSSTHLPLVSSNLFFIPLNMTFQLVHYLEGRPKWNIYS